MMKEKKNVKAVEEMKTQEPQKKAENKTAKMAKTAKKDEAERNPVPKAKKGIGENKKASDKAIKPKKKSTKGPKKKREPVTLIGKLFKKISTDIKAIRAERKKKTAKAEKEKESLTLVGKIIKKIKIDFESVKEVRKQNALKKTDGRIKLVIDSDVAIEIDDQFAIAYALARKDVFDVKAITLAPFRVDWQKNLSIREGMIDSKNEAERLLRLFGLKKDENSVNVYFGSEGFLSEGYDSRNPAVNEIIDLAKENDELYVCCIGTLTNVAMALRLEPKIAKKLKVVWLGTDNLLLDKFEDNNYAKDVVAFNEVAASEVDFTIFPNYLAKGFVTSTYEFDRNITKNSVTQYLSSIINKFQFTETNMGIKTIYDLGPVAYLLNRDKFTEREISPDILIREGKVELPKNRVVTYITSVPKHSFVWTDFLNAINACGEYVLKPQVFFTSDTHFNQIDKVTKKHVPFDTVEEMNEQLVKRWNGKVGPNDVVYHLGDFGDYDFVRRLNGKVILICGKYEEQDYRKDFDKFRAKLLEIGFSDVVKDGMYLDESVLGEKVYLTHKPANRAKDCKTIYGNLKDLTLVEKFGFNVCVSYHYFTPVSTTSAKRYLKIISGKEDF